MPPAKSVVEKSVAKTFKPTDVINNTNRDGVRVDWAVDQGGSHVWMIVSRIVCSFKRAHGVVASHPLRMRKALG